MSTLAGLLSVNSDHIGDMININIETDTTIGIITEDVTSGDTTFVVDNTSIANLKKGMWVRLFNGVLASTRVLCTGIDESTNTVTVKTGIDQIFLAIVPTYVQITIAMVENFYINTPGIIPVGGSKIGAKHFPPGTRIDFIYERNSPSDVVVSYANEILY